MKKIYIIPEKQNNELSCGITCLRMVLNYYKLRVSEKKLIKGVGGIKRFGVRTIKLAESAKKLGFNVISYSFNKKMARNKSIIKKPNKQDIFRMIREKIPVILSVRYYLLYNKKMSKMGHFIVITGYHDDIFYYNDPWDGKEHKIRDNVLMKAVLENAKDSSAYFLSLY